MQLKGFQERIVEKAINQGKGRILLWVPMGRGKTPISCSIASRLSCRRIVVLCKDSGVPVWTRKTTDPEKLLGRDWLEKFSGLKVVVHNLDGLNQYERKAQWELQTSKDEIHVWVCVYNTFAKDMGCTSEDVKRKAKKQGIQETPPPRLIPFRGRWDLLICDECKRISNRRSAAAIAVDKFLYGNAIPYYLPMSGTPGDKGPSSFFAYFKGINKKVFSSYWGFVEHFYTTAPGPFGELEIIERRNDTLAEWERVLNKYCCYVSDEESSEGLPPISREKVYARMDDEQAAMFKDMQKHMVYAGANDIVVAQNPMVRLLRLRQILVCPQILGSSFPVGGAIRTVADIMEESNDTHQTIFTPFLDAFRPFTDYLTNRGIGPIYHLHGGIKPDEQFRRLDAYRKTGGIALCTVKYAEAFSLEPAAKAWFVGYEYTPDENDQAERRLLRITTTYPIWCGYLTYGTPVDERMTDIVAIKRERIDWSKPDIVEKLLLGKL